MFPSQPPDWRMAHSNKVLSERLLTSDTQYVLRQSPQKKRGHYGQKKVSVSPVGSN